MKNTDKSLVEELNESTAIMDRKKVNAKLKELRTAYKKGDTIKLKELSAVFTEIANCLGDEEESVLNDKIDSINKEIEKNGASALNIAKLNNNRAKLALIKDRPLIKEAASNEDYALLDKNVTDRKGKILVAGTVVALLGVSAGSYFISRNAIKDGNQLPASSETPTTTTLSGDPTETISQETINDVYETTMNTNGGYVVETIDIDYSSPTRATTVAPTDNDGNTYSTVTPDATITTIRPTTDSDAVTVVTPTTSSTNSTTATPETSSVPTNSSGVIVDTNNDPVPTTTYIEPTGTDTLPVEPTHETLAPSDYTEADTVTEVVVTVPVETLDPNDPANVKELSIHKGKVKVLTLR